MATSNAPNGRAMAHSPVHPRQTTHHDWLPNTPGSPSVMEPPSGRSSESIRRASAALLSLGTKRSRCSIIDVRDTIELSPLLDPGYSHTPDYESIDTDEESNHSDLSRKRRRARRRRRRKKSGLVAGLSQVPAIALACMLNLMISIPFGVSYFPIGWSSGGVTSDDGGGEDDDLYGDFPVANRVSLGIRMFLFSTIIGQVAFTFCSKFKNPISLQMVENVPFYHALAAVAIEEQGYGIEALSTLFFLFGFSSVLVGAVFYALGALEYGRIVYFFPSHVLVGCIGGIGVFIGLTAVEVSANITFKLDLNSLHDLADQFILFEIVLLFEAVLRILNFVTHDKQRRPRFPLLAPVYFCLITPLFYAGLYAFGVSIEQAKEMGFFFPASSECDTGCDTATGWSAFFNEELVEIWTIIDFSTISWTAVAKAIPTMIALAAFSLIHVPINIPAFGISTDVDTDMNAELIAHGWSNALSGLFAGLQNYMTYSNSVLYAKSGGEGRVSSLIVAVLTAIMFVVGPSIATYIPRCMAGTLLFHIGIDLFLEGVYDSIGNYDFIEYAFIWVITVVMTVYGMTAALIAGIIAAMSTYAAQSIAHLNPIRGTMTAATLRSSAWSRSNEALAILDDTRTGRSRILILQLQGHLFFGNIAQITDNMKEILNKKKDTIQEPWIVMMDFTLVSGMDSSAAHAVAKLKKVMHKAFQVEVTIFVTGSGDGFPCEYALSQELSKACDADEMVDVNDAGWYDSPYTISVSPKSPAMLATKALANYPKERVCESLDSALMFAEDLLIARANSALFEREKLMHDSTLDDLGDSMSFEEEKYYALHHLTNLCKGADEADVKTLLTYFRREEFSRNETIWNQGEVSLSAKILITGTLISYLEGTDSSETIIKGNMLGELGLVHGAARLTTVVCSTERAICFSLSRRAWDKLVKREPSLARIVDLIVIRYLAHRVQHVSNRIFETRCLPI